MNISYIANIRLPTEKAHGYQTMRVCSEWARLGHKVTLLVPVRTNPIVQDAFSYYGLERDFEVVYVPCGNWMRFVRAAGKLAFLAHSWSFLRHAVSRISKESIVFTLDPEAVWYLSRQGFVCFFNAHNWPHRGRLIAWLIARARGVVCNSSGTEEAVHAATCLPTMVAHNAADPNPFVGDDTATLRRELELPQENKLIVYSGHLYGWKGAEILLQCARICETHPELQFVAIGGTPEDVVHAQEKAQKMRNIHFLGHQPRAFVPKYLAAADVLLLPNTKDTEESVRFTSPMKMFEYMAAGVPIIASDLPSIRDILTDQLALFAEAGNPASFAEAILHTLAHPDEAKAKAGAALAASMHYTWGPHAQQIIQFIKLHSGVV